MSEKRNVTNEQRVVDETDLSTGGEPPQDLSKDISRRNFLLILLTIGSGTVAGNALFSILDSSQDNK